VAAAVALALPAMLVAAGLAVDVGMTVWARAVAQSAADLAALAGVQELDLDLLARGERRLMTGPAVARARDVALRNVIAAGGALGPSSAGVDVRVFNVPVGEVFPHPGDGRPMRDPTVCVTVTLRPRLPVLALFRGPDTVTAHADASVLEKKGRGRP
jgi:Flp pilus assembly protein TadG